MRECLFSVVCFLSTAGLFSSVSLDGASTVVRDPHLALNTSETGLTTVKKGGDEFDPAFGQAFLLLTDPSSVPVQTPSSLSDFPFLVPLNTKGSAFEELKFHRSTSSFTIKESGKYCVDYFVKLFGVTTGVPGFSFTGQLAVAVKVNDHFVGEAMMATDSLAFAPTSVDFDAAGVITGSRDILIPLHKGDVVSLYLLAAPQGTGIIPPLAGDPPTIPLPMTFGAPGSGPDIVAYLSLQKIS